MNIKEDIIVLDCIGSCMRVRFDVLTVGFLINNL